MSNETERAKRKFSDIMKCIKSDCVFLFTFTRMLTLIIIALTCLVSVSAFSNKELFSKFLFNGSMIHTHKQWYRFLTHALIHADWIHLMMNMYVLYMFGKIVEETFVDIFGSFRGELYFFLLYFIGIIASSFPSYEKHKNDFY